MVSKTHDREAYRKCFRLFTLLLDSKPEIREIKIKDDTAVVVLNQHIRTMFLPRTFLKRLRAPTIAILHFAKLKSGENVVVVSGFQD